MYKPEILKRSHFTAQMLKDSLVPCDRLGFTVEERVCPNFVGLTGRHILCQQTEHLRIMVVHDSVKDSKRSVFNTCGEMTHRTCPFYDASHQFVARELI